MVGFGEEVEVGFLGEVAAGDIHGVAAGVDNFERGADGFEFAGEFAAGEAVGHDEVGEDEVNLAVVLFPDFQGFGAVAGFEDGVAAVGEDGAGELAHGGFVFDEEDGFAAAFEGGDDAVGVASGFGEG